MPVTRDQDWDESLFCVSGVIAHIFPIRLYEDFYRRRIIFISNFRPTIIRRDSVLEDVGIVSSYHTRRDSSNGNAPSDFKPSILGSECGDESDELAMADLTNRYTRERQALIAHQCLKVQV